MTIQDDHANTTGSTADAAHGNTAAALKGGIDSANDAIDTATSRAADQVDRIRGAVTPALKDGIDRAQALVQQGSTFVSDTTLFARVRASELADQVVGYTRLKPVRALLIAAASGALLMRVIGAMGRRSR